MRKINILQFICPTGFYGAERWVLALANNLNQTEVRCDLAVTEESDSQQNLEILNHYPNIEGQTFKIQLESRFDLKSITQLSKIIRERNIDIIHTHGYKSDILGLIAAKKCGIKSVSTPHGFGEPASFKHKLFVKAGAFSLKFFSRVIPLSQALYDDCIRFGVPKQKLNYIQNGVDLKEVEEYRLTKPTKDPDSTTPKIIGFIGQMVPRKKVSDILQIFEALCERHDNLGLELLGDGSSREELESEANNLKHKDKIDFLGFRNDRMEKLSNFDLFVMTSSSEGIPRCLMEAMAMEIPVSAYNIPGIDQLLNHEETGLLADLDDIATLTKYWEKLLFDPVYANTLASNARSFVHERFSAARMAKEYTVVFQDLINNTNKFK